MEDKQGKPFAGPAGRLLDTALGDACLVKDLQVAAALLS
jgi:uracil-DNA glycosylase